MGDKNKFLTCYSCGIQGHRSSNCKQKQGGNLWCATCKSNTHNDRSCRKRSEAKKVQTQSQSTSVKQNQNQSVDHTFQFLAVEPSPDNTKVNLVSSMLVDTGATSHIVNSNSEFVKFDENFNPESHFLEMADGRKVNGLALEKGIISVNLTKETGEKCNATLHDTLYIPSFPQEIFSVTSATKHGAVVKFESDSGEVVIKDGTRFNIEKKGNLYYLDKCSAVQVSTRRENLDMWHRIMGHYNTKDVLNTEKVVTGMKIQAREEIPCDPVH